MMLWSPSSVDRCCFSCLMKVITASLKRRNKDSEQLWVQISSWCNYKPWPLVVQNLPTNMAEPDQHGRTWPTWPNLTLMLSMPNIPKWLSSSLAVSELCLTLRRGEKEESGTTRSGLNVTEPLKAAGKVWFIRLFSMGYISTTMVTTWYFANTPCQGVFIRTTQFH